ncbi:predicted protein [Naegleria gruberi]|uniref:Predicted protein n=1 Tax=Naegleria gruberi TaxID=5762 RepID=D2VR77_NAEGR|nr:uncharacterized protein NAEGRDRAFT_71489 [Naegleria gruberi]EFC40556.1 predicted protein [Naegleria gruberi]|eukprot:XP_002673300.1 predicted protein [Naegleria gruberi strain NEG-M]
MPQLHVNPLHPPNHTRTRGNSGPTHHHHSHHSHHHPTSTHHTRQVSNPSPPSNSSPDNIIKFISDEDEKHNSDKFKKSLGYTSFTGSYWAGGSSDKAYLAVFDVHVGKQLEVTNWDHTLSDFTEESLTNYNGQDYDSLFAKAKNGFLLNNEFIVYNSAQCTIKFMVEIKQ